MRKMIFLLLVAMTSFGQTKTTKANSFLNGINIKNVQALPVSELRSMATIGDDGVLGKIDPINLTTPQEIKEYIKFLDHVAVLKEKDTFSILTTVARNLEQGYSYDGTNSYFFGTSRIAKYNSSFAIMSENTNSLSGITGVDHMGDGVYLNGFLYAPIESYPAVTGMKIAKFNASDLSLVTTYDISAQGHECSSIATDGKILYISSYVDGSKIWKYSITGDYLGSITLDEPFTNNIQGISYYKGWLYVVEQTRLSKIRIDGKEKTFIATLPGALTNTHRGEGIQVVNGQIRFSILDGGLVTLYALTASGVF